VFSGDGYKLPDALEEQIEAMVLDGHGEFGFKPGPGVGKTNFVADAVKDYVEHLRSSVPNSLDGLRVGVDCANGSASVTAEKLFSALGAEAHIINADPDGENINVNCGSTHIEGLAAFVRENGLDAGVAFDGDADRCLCVDERGNVIDGDEIMAICASDLAERGKLRKRTVVGTVLTNFGFGKFCEENDMRFVATKVGDRFVLEEMLLNEYDFGGEQSGHIIFRDYATTGDGQLTAIQLLSLMKRKGKKLSEMKLMTKYPQVSRNIRISGEAKVLYYTNARIKEAIEAGKKTLGADGRVIVRPSGTEPLIRVMTEGLDISLIDRVADEIADVITAELG
jgi:phosphoglucosamine mutase